MESIFFTNPYNMIYNTHMKYKSLSQKNICPETSMKICILPFLYLLLFITPFSLFSLEDNAVLQGIRVQEGTPYEIVKAIFNADDSTIIIGATKGKWISGSSIGILGTQKRTARELRDPSHLLCDLAVTPDNMRILSAGARGRDPVFEAEINIWTHPGELKKIIDLETHAGYTFITNIAPGPTGSVFLTGGNIKTAKLMDINGTIIRTFYGYETGEDSVFSEYMVDISADKKYVLLHTDYSTHIWTYDGIREHTIPAGYSGILSPAFTPDNLWTVYLTRETTMEKRTRLEFWDHNKGIPGPRFEILGGADYPLSPPAFTRDGAECAVVTNTGINIYSTTDGSVSKVIRITGIATGAAGENVFTGRLEIPRPAYSRDGEYLLVCHPDREKVILIHLATGNRLSIAPAHEGHFIVYDTQNRYDSPGMEGPYFSGNQKKLTFTPGLLDDFFNGGSK
jgi:WD40 repeat protein